MRTRCPNAELIRDPSPKPLDNTSSYLRTGVLSANRPVY
jgi:hypothetical protein